MDWQEEYKRKLVSAAEAVRAVKSGDRVVLPLTGEPPALALALAARREELRDVEVYTGGQTDLGWQEPGWESSFNLNIDCYFGPLVRPVLAQRRADFSPRLYSLHFKPEDEGRPRTRGTDVFMVVLSPPDRHGFCSFGRSMWYKKAFLQRARTVIAEVDENQIRTYGDNFVHISQVHYFVENTTPPQDLELAPPDGRDRAIARLVSGLIRDGDTLQIGVGTTTAQLGLLGAFDDKNDLGWHSETTVRGIVSLAKKGIFTGKHKTRHPGKMVASATSASLEELEFVHRNPMFELYGLDYTNSIPVIAGHDNMVAINGAMAVDLTGQIAAESVGPELYSGHGGQPEFAIGALLSRGGRSITVLTSTSSDGSRSRIVPRLPEGTYVTVPRTFADYVVTEYGGACLLGKPQRRRAEELIAIAHPDFQPELRRQAQRLFYP